MRVAESISINWFTVAMTPSPISFFINSLAFTPSLWERSAMDIASAILKTLLAAFGTVISVFLSCLVSESWLFWRRGWRVR